MCVSGHGKVEEGATTIQDEQRSSSRCRVGAAGRSNVRVGVCCSGVQARLLISGLPDSRGGGCP